MELRNRKYIDSVRLQIVYILMRVVRVHEHSSHTTMHSDRVAGLVVLIANNLGIPERDIAVLWRAALMHDIGKAGISSDLLFSSEKISDIERILIKEHPGWGEYIVSGSPDLKEEARAIRHHHERFDGCGYPDKLSGKKIPLYSRIISVCDVYDAIHSDRSYSKGWTGKKTMAYIIENSGKMFDPKIVDCFSLIYNDGDVDNFYKSNIEGVI